MLPRDPDAREEIFYAAQLRIIELLEQLVKKEAKEVVKNDNGNKSAVATTRKPSSGRGSNNKK